MKAKRASSQNNAVGETGLGSEAGSTNDGLACAVVIWLATNVIVTCSRKFWIPANVAYVHKRSGLLRQSWPALASESLLEKKLYGSCQRSSTLCMQRFGACECMWTAQGASARDDARTRVLLNNGAGAKIERGRRRHLYEKHIMRDMWKSDVREKTMPLVA